MRLFSGAAAGRGWWEGLAPDEQFFFKAVALARLRPDLTLTKLAAAAVLGAKVLRAPGDVTCAAMPGKPVSRGARRGMKTGALPGHARLAGRRVTLHSDGSVESARCAAPAARPFREGPGFTEVACVCTSPACTIYDVAAAFPLQESLVTINSLLSAHANRHRRLPPDHPWYAKGRSSAHLNASAVAGILRAKSRSAFLAQAEKYRQHGLRLERAAELYAECLDLVWQNRDRRGVRRALLALLLATDKCESPGESLCCARFFQDGYAQPVMQPEIYEEGSGRIRFRADGAWDLRGGAQQKRRPLEQELHLTAGRKQILLFEFDGKIKYEDARYMNGRDKGSVLEDQIRREEALRGAGYEIVRFSWADLMEPGAVRGKLSRFPVPTRRRRPRRR